MFNMQYYVGLVAPLQTVDQVCALLDDPAVRRKYGSQCEEMKQHWLASKQADAKLLSEIDNDMITEGKLALVPALAVSVLKPRTPPGTFAVVKPDEPTDLVAAGRQNAELRKYLGFPTADSPAIHPYAAKGIAK